jgi:hypothetical protein
MHLFIPHEAAATTTQITSPLLHTKTASLTAKLSNQTSCSKQASKQQDSEVAATIQNPTKRHSKIRGFSPL